MITMTPVKSNAPVGIPTSRGTLIPEPALPWIQLAAGVLGMVAIANLQYGWTLFVDPIEAKFHWGRPAIQVAFTLFVLAETWLLPIEGYLVDRFGPRRMVALGGVLVGWPGCSTRGWERSRGFTSRPWSAGPARGSSTVRASATR